MHQSMRQGLRGIIRRAKRSAIRSEHRRNAAGSIAENAASQNAMCGGCVFSCSNAVNGYFPKGAECSGKRIEKLPENQTAKFMEMEFSTQKAFSVKRPCSETEKPRRRVAFERCGGVMICSVCSMSIHASFSV